jgi:hypothetical protein
MTGGNPVEEKEGQDTPKERRDRAQSIPDVTHNLALGTQILHLAKLQGGAPAAAHHPPARSRLHLRLDAKKGHAGNAKAPGIEEQDHDGVAQLVQNHARRIEPEPDQQSPFAKKMITDLIHTSAQALARKTQQREEDKNSRDKKPGAVCGQLFLQSRVHTRRYPLRYPILILS